MFRNLLKIVLLTWRQMRTSDVQLLTGSLAFSTVLSIVPLLAVSLSVFNALGGFESLMGKLEPYLLQNLVEGSGAEVSHAIRHALARIQSGALGLTGALGLFFVSTKLFHDVEEAVQRVWQIPSSRSLPWKLAIYWLVMFLGPLILAAILGLAGSRDLDLVKQLSKSTVGLGSLFVALVAIYKFVPDCKVAWRNALSGALAATIAVAVAQSFYGQITRKTFSYNQIYGSLASIPIFLIWILILWWICLAGVALTAVLEREQSAKAGLAS
jgi:membrane protein